MRRPPRWLAVVVALGALGAAGCGDDDEETPTPNTGESEVDGGEADAGDQPDDTPVDDGGATTGGGTQGNQEHPDEGQRTTPSTAQDGG